MAGKQRYGVKQVISAIEGSGGIKTIIAQTLDCSRNTVDEYLRRYPSAQKAYEDECEKTGDVVESQILKKCKEGDTTMLIFFAKTRLKNRGYSERQEQDRSVDWGLVGRSVAEALVRSDTSPRAASAHARSGPLQGGAGGKAVWEDGKSEEEGGH